MIPLPLDRHPELQALRNRCVVEQQNEHAIRYRDRTTGERHVVIRPRTLYVSWTRINDHEYDDELVEDQPMVSVYCPDTNAHAGVAPTSYNRSDSEDDTSSNSDSSDSDRDDTEHYILRSGLPPMIEAVYQQKVYVILSLVNNSIQPWVPRKSEVIIQFHDLAQRLWVGASRQRDPRRATMRIQEVRSTSFSSVDSKRSVELKQIDAYTREIVVQPSLLLIPVAAEKTLRGMMAASGVQLSAFMNESKQRVKESVTKDTTYEQTVDVIPYSKLRQTNPRYVVVRGRDRVLAAIHQRVQRLRVVCHTRYSYIELNNAQTSRGGRTSVLSVDARIRAMHHMMSVAAPKRTASSEASAQWKRTKPDDSLQMQTPPARPLLVFDTETQRHVDIGLPEHVDPAVNTIIARHWLASPNSILRNVDVMRAIPAIASIPPQAERLISPNTFVYRNTNLESGGSGDNDGVTENAIYTIVAKRSATRYFDDVDQEELGHAQNPQWHTGAPVGIVVDLHDAATAAAVAATTADRGDTRNLALCLLDGMRVVERNTLFADAVWINVCGPLDQLDGWRVLKECAFTNTPSTVSTDELIAKCRELALFSHNSDIAMNDASVRTGQQIANEEERTQSMEITESAAAVTTIIHMPNALSLPDQHDEETIVTSGLRVNAPYHHPLIHRIHAQLQPLSSVTGVNIDDTLMTMVRRALQPADSATHHADQSAYVFQQYMPEVYQDCVNAMERAAHAVMGGQPITFVEFECSTARVEQSMNEFTLRISTQPLQPLRPSVIPTYREYCIHVRWVVDTTISMTGGVNPVRIEITPAEPTVIASEKLNPRLYERARFSLADLQQRDLCTSAAYQQLARLLFLIQWQAMRSIPLRGKMDALSEFVLHVQHTTGVTTTGADIAAIQLFELATYLQLSTLVQHVQDPRDGATLSHEMATLLSTASASVLFHSITSGGGGGGGIVPMDWRTCIHEIIAMHNRHPTAAAATISMSVGVPKPLEIVEETRGPLADGIFSEDETDTENENENENENDVNPHRFNHDNEHVEPQQSAKQPAHFLVLDDSDTTDGGDAMSVTNDPLPPPLSTHAARAAYKADYSQDAFDDLVPSASPSPVPQRDQYQHQERQRPRSRSRSSSVSILDITPAKMPRSRGQINIMTRGGKSMAMARPSFLVVSDDDDDDDDDDDTDGNEEDDYHNKIENIRKGTSHITLPNTIDSDTDSESDVLEFLPPTVGAGSKHERESSPSLLSSPKRTQTLKKQARIQTALRSTLMGTSSENADNDGNGDEIAGVTSLDSEEGAVQSSIDFVMLPEPEPEPDFVPQPVPAIGQVQQSKPQPQTQPLSMPVPKSITAATTTTTAATVTTTPKLKMKLKPITMNQPTPVVATSTPITATPTVTTAIPTTSIPSLRVAPVYLPVQTQPQPPQPSTPAFKPMPNVAVTLYEHTEDINWPYMLAPKPLVTFASATVSESPSPPPQSYGMVFNYTRNTGAAGAHGSYNMTWETRADPKSNDYREINADTQRNMYRIVDEWATTIVSAVDQCLNPDTPGDAEMLQLAQSWLSMRQLNE